MYNSFGFQSGITPPTPPTPPTTPLLVCKKNMITHTGTASNTLIASENISAFIEANTMLQITAQFRKLVGTGSAQGRMYVNNSASLVGATLIASWVSVLGANIISDNVANFPMDSSNQIYAIGAVNNVATRYVNNLGGTLINIPSPCFLIWAMQLNTSTDSIQLLNSNVIKYG